MFENYNVEMNAYLLKGLNDMWDRFFAKRNERKNAKKTVAFAK